MAVQALLPLLLAAEIRLADAGELPICDQAAAEQVAGPVTHQNRHSGSSHSGGMAACPICQAVACGQAIADTAVAPPLPVPQGYAMAAAFTPQHQPLQASHSSSYHARAPPSGV